MKKTICTLCGGTGVAYEVPDPVEQPKPKHVPLLEKQYVLPLEVTEEEEEAWQTLDLTHKNMRT
jgi:hypothetical protein